MRVEKLQLDILDASGAVRSATVYLDEGDGSESGLVEGFVRITLRWDAEELSATDVDYFSALAALREKLGAQGLMPRCYGACRNLVLSGMCYDMGQGLKGYLSRLGQRTKMDDLVSIFDSGPDMDLASVAEQRAFQDAWLKSVTGG